MGDTKRIPHPNSLKNLKPVKKGDPSRNPLGAGVAKAIYRKMTQAELKEIVELSVIGDLQELARIASTTHGMSFMKCAVAKCLYDAHVKGDWHTINAILERILGKVPDRIEHSGSLPQVIVTLPGNGRDEDEKK